MAKNTDPVIATLTARLKNLEAEIALLKADKAVDTLAHAIRSWNLTASSLPVLHSPVGPPVSPSYKALVKTALANHPSEYSNLDRLDVWSKVRDQIALHQAHSRVELIDALAVMTTLLNKESAASASKATDTDSKSEMAEKVGKRSTKRRSRPLKRRQGNEGVNKKNSPVAASQDENKNIKNKQASSECSVSEAKLENPLSETKTASSAQPILEHDLDDDTVRVIGTAPESKGSRRKEKSATAKRNARRAKSKSLIIVMDKKSVKKPQSELNTEVWPTTDMSREVGAPPSQSDDDKELLDPVSERRPGPQQVESDSGLALRPRRKVRKATGKAS